jgi:hypothetical protein
VAELAYAAALRAALCGFKSHRAYQSSLTIFVGEWAGRKRLAGSTPALSATAEGTAEWPATGPENQSMVMSHGRSIRLPSAKLAQVRESG